MMGGYSRRIMGGYVVEDEWWWFNVMGCSEASECCGY